MISVDIETTGLNPKTHGMVSLGAVHLETGEEYYKENCIMPNVICHPKALEVNGFTEREVYDTSKVTASRNLAAFISWAETFDEDTLTLMGWNFPSFDLRFMKHYYERGSYHGPDWIFGHRYIDLHSQAQLVTGKSMSGWEFREEYGIEHEPEPHNALEGAKVNVRMYNALKHMVRDHGYASGSYIKTNSGNQIDFGKVDLDQITIEDIAHGLSHTCRFAGQVNRYYSVAQHSVGVANLVQSNGGNDVEVMQAILHDAPEAFLCDVPSPAKEMMPDYVKVEKRLMEAIGDKFGIDLRNLSPLVKECDQKMLFHEATHLFDDGLVDWIPDTAEELKIYLTERGDLVTLPPRYAKDAFLKEFHSIQEMVNLEG